MSPPTIDRYRFGEIVIDGRRYTRDVIIYPDRVDGNWWRGEGHSVTPADLWEAAQARPEILVVGQGSAGRMDVPAETRRWLESQSIRVIAEPTGQAWQTYNRLCKEHRVVAALHLTC